jgi:phosphopantetheinyl transferase (holo-ACP synthase)
MILRVGLDLRQQNLAIRQVMKFGNDLEKISNPVECAHILEDVKSASCIAATWF